MSEAVSVRIRIRPLVAHELRDGHQEAVQGGADGRSVDITDPRDQQNLRKYFADSKGRRQSLSYAFDGCMPASQSQQDVFQNSGVHKLLDVSLDGYASTIFAYGQTGAGKTYTIFGEPTVPEKYGLIPNSVAYLLQSLRDSGRQDDDGVTVSITFVEVYNERVRDLLNPASGNLEVAPSGRGFQVKGAAKVPCKSMDALARIIEAGTHNRTVSGHDMNDRSSRGHAIFTVHVDSEVSEEELGSAAPVKESPTPDDGAGPQMYIRYGRICFVDLAGCENLKQTDSQGIAIAEAGQINKSLFSLGKVINALSKQQKGDNNIHIPYRDSMLTKLLVDSLGGSTRSLMFGCCSSSDAYVGDSLRMLQFAGRVMNVTNKPEVLLAPKDRMIRDLRAEVSKLQEENSILRKALVEGDPNASVVDVPSEMLLSPSQRKSSALPLDVASDRNVTPKRRSTPLASPIVTVSDKQFEADSSGRQVSQQHASSSRLPTGNSQAKAGLSKPPNTGSSSSSSIVHGSQTPTHGRRATGQPPPGGSRHGTGSANSDPVSSVKNMKAAYSVGKARPSPNAKNSSSRNAKHQMVMQRSGSTAHQLSMSSADDGGSSAEAVARAMAIRTQKSETSFDDADFGQTSSEYQPLTAASLKAKESELGRKLSELKSFSAFNHPRQYMGPAAPLNGRRKQASKSIPTPSRVVQDKHKTPAKMSRAVSQDPVATPSAPCETLSEAQLERKLFGDLMNFSAVSEMDKMKAKKKIAPPSPVANQLPPGAGEDSVLSVSTSAHGRTSPQVRHKAASASPSMGKPRSQHALLPSQIERQTLMQELELTRIRVLNERTALAAKLNKWNR